MIPGLVTSAPGSPTRSNRTPKPSTTSTATPSSTASDAVRVRSLPASITPSMATSSSTIASATDGSRPRRSARARNSLRMALTIFSDALSPVPTIGVAAPIDDAGTM